jgi:hypothetical protein
MRFQRRTEAKGLKVLRPSDLNRQAQRPIGKGVEDAVWASR